MQIFLSKRVASYYLPSEQFFSLIMVRKNYFDKNDDVVCFALE